MSMLRGLLNGGQRAKSLAELELDDEKQKAKKGVTT